MVNKARIRCDGLAALVFWGDDEKGFDRTAFVIPGLPYELTMSPVTELLVACGFGVIQPQYIGSYDSAGDFTPENCIETLLRFRDIIKETPQLFDLRGERTFTVGRRVEVLAAHSFGTYAAIGAILKGIEPRLAIMFSPMFEFGTRSKEVGLRVDLEKHSRHIIAALPLTIRMIDPTVLRAFFLTQEEFQPTKLQCGKRVPMLTIVGDQDPSLVAQTNDAYVQAFVDRYKSCLDLISHVVVAGGTHDIETLVTEDVARAIEEALPLPIGLP